MPRKSKASQKRRTPVRTLRRRMTIAGGEWSWQCGHGGVTIQQPDGARVLVPMNVFSGLTWTDLDCMLLDQCPYQVTPGNVAKYIQQHLLTQRSG